MFLKTMVLANHQASAGLRSMSALQSSLHPYYSLTRRLAPFPQHYTRGSNRQSNWPTWTVETTGFQFRSTGTWIHITWKPDITMRFYFFSSLYINHVFSRNCFVPSGNIFFAVVVCSFLHSCLLSKFKSSNKFVRFWLSPQPLSGRLGKTGKRSELAQCP